jgi:predicted methyltransferase
MRDNHLGCTDQVDFALAFWMVHEVSDTRTFFSQVYSILKPAGTFLIAEPKMHVTRTRFEEILSCARETGFMATATPAVRFSRSVVLGKSSTARPVAQRDQ